MISQAGSCDTCLLLAVTAPPVIYESAVAKRIESVQFVPCGLKMSDVLLTAVVY
jgi:hypothetical protein